MQAHDVHFELSRRAADIANHMLVADPRIPPRMIGIFRADGQHNLGLVFPESVNQLDSRIVEVVQEIGRRAVKRALIDNPDLFVGLILGEARKGRNYFTEYHK